MDKSEFWRLLEGSVIVQSTVTLVSVAVTSYMVLCMKDIPKEWWTIMGLILGFWFAEKKNHADRQAQLQLLETAMPAVDEEQSE